MKPIRDVIGRELLWHRTRMIPVRYELRADAEPLATVEWLNPFRAQVRAAAASDAWRMRKAGPFSRRVLVTDWTNGRDAAEYTGGVMRGAIRLADGREFELSRLGFLPRAIAVRRRDGGEILRITWRWVSLRVVGSLAVEPSAAAEPALGMLASLALFVLVLRRKRAAHS